MTATRVFYIFLRKELTLDGYIYFKRILSGEYVGGYRKTKIRRTYYPKATKTFVDDFIKNGQGKTLKGFMGNLLRHIEPALVRYKYYNTDYNKRIPHINPWAKYSNDIVYKDTYCRLWRKFLDENVENGDKRIYHGKLPEYKFKESFKL